MSKASDLTVRSNKKSVGGEAKRQSKIRSSTADDGVKSDITDVSVKTEREKQKYLEYVNSFSPPTKHFSTALRAFGVGGLICCIGQFFRYMLYYFAGLDGDVLAGAVSIIMIFLGTLFTGLGIYDRIGKNAGAGSIVPITGFANSVCSPAIEFKTEGYVYGMAAKMFIIAGPIIVFGVLLGSAVGLLYYFIGM